MLGVQGVKIEGHTEIILRPRVDSGGEIAIGYTPGQTWKAG